MLKKNSIYENNRVTYVPVYDILPNPAQPRKVFDREGLMELTESIRCYGVIQPLSVRKRYEGYELVAGERRLRAAKLAGLTEVPCILMSIDDRQSGLIAMVENLQRRDLDFIEEAQGLANLMQTYGLSQEAAAAKVGKSQSAVANKLRILKHSPRILELLRSSGLSERHARALLRIEDEEARYQALQVIAQKAMTVARAEQYIDSLLTQPQEKPGPNRTWLLRDVRLFINSVNNNLKVMREAGVGADMERQDTDQGIVLTIRIPKAANSYKSS